MSADLSSPSIIHHPFYEVYWQKQKPHKKEAKKNHREGENEIKCEGECHVFVYIFITLLKYSRQPCLYRALRLAFGGHLVALELPRYFSVIMTLCQNCLDGDNLWITHLTSYPTTAI
jgi:hypothetical protein